MMRTRRFSDILLTIAALVVVALVIAAVSAASLMASGRPPLRVALNAWPGYECFSLAEELGYFDDEGVEVKLIHLGSLGDSRRMFERGQADLLASSMVEVIYVANENPNSIKAIAIADYSKGADVLLARREVTSVSELRGQRIGVEPHSLDVVNLAFALRSAEMSLSDVVLVPLSQPEMAQAALDGRVDAVQTYPPVSSTLLRDPRFHRVFDSSQIPGAVVDCISASPQALQMRRPEVVKVMRAYFRAQQFLLEHPERAVPMLSRYLRLTPPEVEESLQGMGLVPQHEQRSALAPESTFVKSLSEAAAQLRQTGLHGRTLEWSASVDDSIVREIDAK